MESTVGTTDQRPSKDWWKGRILDFLDFPLLGYGPEAVAGAESIFLGKNYDDALNEAEFTGAMDDMHTPIWSRVPSFAASAPLATPAFSGAAALTGKGIEKVRKGLGFTEKPVGRFAKGAQDAASNSVAFGGADAVYQSSGGAFSGSDGIDQYRPEQTATFAAVPILGGIFGGAGHIAGKAWAGGKDIAKYLFGGKPAATVKPRSGTRTRKPPEPPRIDPKTMRAINGRPRKPSDPHTPRQPSQPTVRQDIDAAIEASKRRKRK